MNKRIKKKHLYMKLEDVCESIVETISVPDHSTLVMRIDTTKRLGNYSYKSEWNKLVRIIKYLKQSHDINVFMLPSIFEVAYSGRGNIPYDEIMKKLISEEGVPISTKSTAIVNGEVVSTDTTVPKDLKKEW